jgi:hypothetical protein
MGHPSSFNLYLRKIRNGKRIWYYRIIEDGKRSSGRSTGQTGKRAAHDYVLALIDRAALRLGTSPTFEEHARDSWRWDRCPYITQNM